MGKIEFLAKLESLLSRVPEKDRKEMMYDYEEHFEIGLANGKDEEELIAELGDPYVIARDLLADYRIDRDERVEHRQVDKERIEPNRVDQIKTSKSESNVLRAIFIMIGLFFINVIFILGPVIGIIGAYIGLCATAILLTLSPIIIIFAYVMGYTYESFTACFFVSITAFSLGALFSITMFYVGKFIYYLVVRYIKFNIRLIKGGK
ncbi:hypothetical protein ACE38V_22345 [Cytobacillus sp. Hz8]|uniref:HAAS signaling domain-containing protein n=1 Tax=Cytobacillus sp. Hz8 TaxID=3347168 RepID=UPI0035E3116E